MKLSFTIIKPSKLRRACPKQAFTLWKAFELSAEYFEGFRSFCWDDGIIYEEMISTDVVQSQLRAAKLIKSFDIVVSNLQSELFCLWQIFAQMIKLLQQANSFSGFETPINWQFDVFSTHAFHYDWFLFPDTQISLSCKVVWQRFLRMDRFSCGCCLIEILELIVDVN